MHAHTKDHTTIHTYTCASETLQTHVKPKRMWFARRMHTYSRNLGVMHFNP